MKGRKGRRKVQSQKGNGREGSREGKEEGKGE